MAIKKTASDKKGRTNNFIPYDPNTDEERSSASSYLPPSKPTPKPTPPPEASYEAERQVESAPYRPDIQVSSDTFDQPPSFSPPERLDEPEETFSPDTFDQPPSLNLKQFEYAKQQRGDQPPSLSITPTTPPSVSFDNTKEPTVEDIKDLNRATEQYKEIAEETNQRVDEVNKLLEEQKYRANELNRLAEEIEKEIGIAPFDPALLQDREAEIIARQTDLEDRIKKFELNPFGQTDEQGYFVDYDRMFDEQDKINEDITKLSEDFEVYNMWANSAEQPDVTMLTDSYERQLADYSRLQSNIFNKSEGLKRDIQIADNFYQRLEERGGELRGLETDLQAQLETNKRILFNAPQIDQLPDIERGVESLDLIYSPLSERGTEFIYDPTAEQGKKISEIIKPEPFQRPEFDLETPNLLYDFSRPDPLSETQDTVFEPDSFFSRNPLELTTGDLLNPLNYTPKVGRPDALYNKINEIEDSALSWLDRNIGQKETLGGVQKAIYHATVVGNTGIYNFQRGLLDAGSYPDLVNDIRRAKSDAELVYSLGNWGESVMSPQVGTVVEFLDIPYYYNQIKKLDDIRVLRFDGDKNTTVSDVDDYLLMFATLGGLTIKDRGVRLNFALDDTLGIPLTDIDEDWEINPLKISGQIAVKYIGQSPETYTDLDFWLSSPLAELPAYDPLDALRRSDEFIERNPFMDVLAPREETAKILRKFEDEEGNPPENFSWGFKKSDKNLFGFDVDEEFMASDEYKELLPYIQARAEDDYIRPIDLIFTVTEVALAYPTTRYMGKLATAPLRGVLKMGKKISNQIPALRGKVDIQDIDILRKTPANQLSPYLAVNKKLVEIDDAIEKLDELKLKDLQQMQEAGLRNQNWLYKKIIPPALANFSANRLKSQQEKVLSLIHRNSIPSQLEEINKAKPLTQDEIIRNDEMKAYLMYLRDFPIDKKYMKEASKGIFESNTIKKIKENGDLLNDKKIAHDLHKVLYGGTNYTPSFVDLKSEGFIRPIGAMYSFPSRYKANAPAENLQLAEQNFSDIFNGLLKDKNAEESANFLYDELSRLRKYDKDKNIEKALDIDQIIKEYEDNPTAYGFEDSVIGWLTRRKKNHLIVKSNAEALLKSNKLSSANQQKLKSRVSSLDKLLIENPTSFRTKPKTNNENNIKALIGESITMPKSFKDAQDYKVKDGEKLEESLDDPSNEKDKKSKKPPSDDDSKTPPFPPTNIPDPTKPKKEPDPTKRKREPDSTKPKKKPDPTKSKKLKEGETKKVKEGETKKRKDPETIKKKKLKDPDTIKKKKLKKAKKIKEPDFKKKKRRRLKDRDFPTTTSGGEQDTTTKKPSRLYPALVQWKDGENYVTYDLNTNKKTVRDYPLAGGVKGAGNTPSTTLKVIRKSPKRPSGFNRRVGNLTLQIKSPEIVTVKKLEKNLYNKNKEFVFKS